MGPSDAPPLADRIADALARRDPAALEPLLDPAVRWGDEGTPRACRGRDDVLATFSRLLDTGVFAEVREVFSGPAGVVCELVVHWPDGGERRGIERLFHAYLAPDGMIVEIRRYDDRDSALEAVGAAAG